MSKKRTRYQRHHHNHAVVCTTKDVHHLLWQRRHWNKSWQKALREHPYCKIAIPKNTLHRMIHEYVEDIPVPDENKCFGILEAIQGWIEGGFISMNDPIERRLEVLIMCFKHGNPHTADALKKQLEVVTKFYEGGQ